MAGVRGTTRGENRQRPVRQPSLAVQTEPLFAFLEGEAGVRTTSQVARVSAFPAPTAHRQASEPGSDLAILRVEEIGDTSDTRPVWHSCTRFQPSAMTFDMVRHRTGVSA